MDEIRLIESISEMVPGAEAQTFTQDWDLHEGPSAAKELLTDTAPSVLGTIELQEQTGGLYCVAEEMAQKCSGKLLEVGSGVGRFVQVLKKQTSHIHVLDNNLRALFENRRQYPDVSRVVGDAINMPFASETFDTVVALNVIDLLDEPEGFLEEAARILSAKGRLLLSTPDPALGVPDTDRTRLERCVRDAGFEILQIEDNRLWTRRPKPYELQVFCSQILLAELL
jgi:SAM-dependent methyltransferase